ncbi:hypothetical protein ACJIZ3_016773 [Penstemon smallii]|uniref:Uncharacterized protein n=1 Tax=Penstemon smallii TaxID=265156 RepID=A0ABD3SU82_9LAMI
METLVVVAHHRNHHQYYDRNCGHGSTKFRSLGSAPSGNFQGINCRAFESGAGLLPTPSKSCSMATPITKKVPSASPKTPSPSMSEYPSSSSIENQKSLRRTTRNIMAPIPIKIMFENEGLSFSERWAGPAYSNSPPPSSLPMPKFSVHPKRTVSLDLPKSVSEIDFHPIARSAPTSPSRERKPWPNDPFDSADSATKTLRRILNLTNE